jgi:outer membrane lipoprotein carrier protein
LQADNLETPSAQLANRLQALGDMQAEFSQVVIAEDDSVLDESSGWVAWQHPAQFRWEVLEPLQQTLLIDGKNYYQYDKDLQQLLVQPLSDDISVLPKLLLSGNATSIEREFYVASIDSNGEYSSTSVGFLLQPKEADALFSEVSLWFEDKQLLSIGVTDELGQLSQFRFSPLTDNSMLPTAEEMFVIDPEPEVDIIYQ